MRGHENTTFYSPVISSVQVLKEIEFSSAVYQFNSALSELRNVLMERLLTTPLEVLQQNEFIEDVEANTSRINDAAENLRNDLADSAEEAERKVKSRISLLLEPAWACESALVALSGLVDAIQNLSYR